MRKPLIYHNTKNGTIMVHDKVLLGFMILYCSCFAAGLALVLLW